MPGPFRRRAIPAAGCLLALLCAGCAVPGPAPGDAPAAAPATPPAVGEAPQWDHDWVRRAVFYEVFVRSFADSDGDGVGDFAGLTARLDALNDGRPGEGDDLEVDGLWLMPVFESPSYHGYDVVDYERIDAEYGSEEDFDRFLAEAHRRGIRVILDLVVNHSGVDHPWFQEAAADPASPRRPWYVWRDDDPGWTQPWGGSNPTWHRSGDAFYYGVFWGGMPDLNWEHPPVREEMARIARAWLDRGVDGFRLDATRHLVAAGPGQEQNDRPDTHRYLADFAAAVRRHRPDALLVGENWTDTATIATYYGSTERVRGGDGLPMSFDFPLAGAILEGVAADSAEPVTAALAEIAATYPPGVLDATFLTNHDMVRVATQLAGDEAALRLAAAVLLTLPGTPFLYYGEEIGLPNGPTRDDRDKRTPLPWTAEEPGRGFTAGTPWHPFAPGSPPGGVGAQQADPESLWSWYRDLVRLRHAHPALARGAIDLVAAPPEVLAFERREGGERLLVAHNLAAEPREIELPAGEPLLGPTSTAAAGRALLPARSSSVWRLAP